MWSILAAASVLLTSSPQSTAVDAPRAPAIDSARALVRALMERQHIPGLSVTVSVGDSVAWSEGFGFADLAARRPATPVTQYRIGSVSKLFTAMLLMRLVELHRVALDTPISTYLALPAPYGTLTLRQLAGHLGGVRHYRGNEFFTQTHYSNLRAALDVFLRDSLVAPPGTRYFYSSYGFNLIGAVLEAVMQQPYPELLRTHVLTPLGLQDTRPDSAPAAPERAQLYAVSSGGAVSDASLDDLSGRWPSGGLLSSTEDLARLGRAVLHPGLLTAASLRLLVTPQQLRSGAATSVGLAWRVSADSAGHTYWHHGGTSNGGSAFLLVYPARGLVVAIASNAYTGWGEREAVALARLFLLGRLPN